MLEQYPFIRRAGGAGERHKRGKVQRLERASPLPTHLQQSKDECIHVQFTPAENSTLSRTKHDDPTEQPSATPLRSVPLAEMSSTHTAPASPAEPTIIPSSVSAPDVIIATKPLVAASMLFSPSVDFTILQASRTSSTDALSSIGSGIAEGSSGTDSPAEPDMQILEALRSKDRLWVLKLGESMETLINERKQ